MNIITQAMQGCKYKDILKCKECTYSLHKECKLFVTAHAKEVARPLLPFVYSSKFTPKGRCMWTKDVNRAKSLAVQCAVKTNKGIKKLTMSQAITLALNSESLEDTVVYIECTQRPNGDVEKLKGVLTSFIESTLLNNTVFVVYVAPTVTLSFDFERI